MYPQSEREQELDTGIDENVSEARFKSLAMAHRTNICNLLFLLYIPLSPYFLFFYNLTITRNLQMQSFHRPLGLGS